MKLRHLILLTSALGACGALLLAADMFRRLREAEAAIALQSGPPRDDSVLFFGMSHTMGLIALAFLFLALFMLLLIAIREPNFVATIEGQQPPHARIDSTQLPTAPATVSSAPAVEVVPDNATAEPIAEPANVSETTEIRAEPLETPSPPHDPPALPVSVAEAVQEHSSNRAERPVLAFENDIEKTPSAPEQVPDEKKPG
ncbi:MAG TPA: hypothetical protein VEK08_22015 [Planctomycetota bacterium]|nr:hypothetical protein [Planctomycetota bacterium]